MTYSFACGDVLPGCPKRFSGPDQETVLAGVADHAAADHDLRHLPPAVLERVAGAIRAA